MKKLTTLNLRNTGVTNAGLAHVNECEQLTSLSLSKTRISNDGLGSMSKLKKLESLDLSDCGRIDSAELAHFKRMHQLQSLNLASNAATVMYGEKGFHMDEAGLLPLKGLDKLRDLNLANCAGVSDDARLAHVDSLPQLRSINLKGTNVSVAAMARLRERNITVEQ